MPEHAYGHMVQERYVTRVRALAARRDTAIAALRRPADAARYCAGVRAKIRRIFGPMPRRTPLNPRVTGRLVDRHGVIEKVVFESRPGHHVTANLYLPRGRGPFPGVLGSCGHDHAGKAGATYQAFSIALMRRGFAVLIYDPVSQGERDQYDRLGLAEPPPLAVLQHIMAGNQQALLGEFFGAWRAWDGIRALDYLLSLPEVDPTRVGMTGNSGGGTLTSYVTALDDRFTMAAPSCFVTTYLANLENELPGDSEQCPPGILAAGLDIGDFLLARAPRPVMLLGQERDFFDRRGLEKTYEQVRRVYALLGATKNVELFIGPDAHGFSRANREAMVRFFSRRAGVRGAAREQPITPRTPSELFAAPGGKVSAIPGDRSIVAFNRESAARLASGRGVVEPKKLNRRITDLLKLSPRRGTPHFRVLPPWSDEQDGQRFGVAWRFGVETEPGIQAILHVWESRAERERIAWRPAPPALDEAVLYVPHAASHAEVLAGLPRGLRGPLLSLDVRGVGESWPLCTYAPDRRAPHGVEYFYAAHSLMLGESYLGGRVHDLLLSLDLLAATGTRRVHLVGRGQGAVSATFAACLHPLVKRVTLWNAPRSFDALARAATFDWPLSALPYGVLRRLDLPDCYRALKRKLLRLVRPGAMPRGEDT